MNEEPIFAEAIGKRTPEERAAYLDRACQGDAGLRRRVESLLAAHDHPDRFLDEPVPGMDETCDLSTVSEAPGTVIGRYKLLQQIGEGGFGVVYMAEQQEPVRRKVALKIVKPGMDSKEVIARFEAEQQALAMMDHPNIARVFDAGATASGRPYFVMELVRGIQVTQYCDENNLTPRERLELFVSVCNAVQHAHQKGIIHRDIKPNNVLVTLHDGKPVTKVIDFGVAKALNQRLTERTLFTKFTQLIGTPAYMSPEQAEMSGLDVDTRTDIYSLGVLLYELLTGTTPFETKRLHAAAYDEIRRIIREEEPPRPSTKVSTLGQAASTVAAHRKTEPQKLSAFLRGDLDWIVMKALEKDRTRRYDTAKDFAADVLRHLNHEPVEASPPSASYRLTKFVRRNKAALAVAAVVGLMLLCVVAATGIASVAYYKRAAAEFEAQVIAQRLSEEEVMRQQAAKELKKAEERERDVQWLRSEALPQLERLKSEQKWVAAWAIARKAREKFPDDSNVRSLCSEVSCTWTVLTEPAGAKVVRKPHGVGAAAWEPLGSTPIDRSAVARGMFLWKIELEGYEPAEGLAGPQNVDIRRTLAKKGQNPGMVLVESVAPSGQKTVFWIDRCEVTNREFKEFVDAGGYRDQKYWMHPIVKSGSTVPSGEVFKEFLDSTGKPGPATWANGTYPKGVDDFPVQGISWYEAAAYAEFRSKQLPTVNDWEKAASLDQYAQIVPESNFAGKGPAAVGARRGIGFFGILDMAGNVKEWCWNRTAEGYRTMRGGAWNEPGYMFQLIERFAPLERRNTFGFRCVKHVTPAQPGDLADLGAESPESLTVPDPISQKELERLMTVFRYDKKAPLNARVIAVDKGSPAYRHETVQIDAAYGGEKLNLHLYLPEGGGGHFQTLVYFPGIGAIPLKQFSDGSDLVDTLIPLGLVARGRAVCWPVYKGTFERNDGFGSTLTSIQELEFNKQMVKDLCRAVDYLASRPEFDMDRLAYLGFSWGGNIGPLMAVVESRFKASVFVAGALHHEGLDPEINPAIYAPFATKPVLMLNGRTDKVARQAALFRLLGASDKTREMYDSGHIVPVDPANERINQWLTARFGEVSRKPVSRGETADRLVQLGESRYSHKAYAEAAGYFRDALEVRKRELGAEHPQTLKVKYLLGTALEKQDLDAEAFGLLEGTLLSQEKQLGKDHADTRQTAKAFADICGKIAWSIGLRSDASADERDRALDLARRALALDPAEPYRRLVLALVEYRHGDWRNASQSLDKSFAVDDPFVGHWLLAAMVSWRLGDEQAGKEWYAAARAWIAKEKIDWQPVLQWSAEAAALLGLPAEWPPADWKRARYIAVYSHLIEQQPKAAQLYHSRGTQYGASGEWDKAFADYAKAAELNPRNWRHGEAHAAACLHRGDTAAYDDACRKGLARFPADKAPGVRMDWILLSALGPTRPIEANELLRFAEEAVREPAIQKSDPWIALVRGMVLYRCGRFEEALETFQTSGFVNPKDELLTLVFRAMTHRQLGDAYSSRKLLAKAREEFNKQLSPLDGPELPFQDRPVVWAMVQTAMQEAEASIPTPGSPHEKRVKPAAGQPKASDPKPKP